MPSTQPRPILNTSLPPQFRQIRIELAREPGHPEGDASVAYTIVAPLDADGRIDQKLWRAHRGTPAGSRGVARTRRTNMVTSSTIRAVPGVFTMTATSSCPRISATISADEHFVTGEYVSINESGKMHTYRVVSVSRL